jgi:DnaK suppressor protein
MNKQELAQLRDKLNMLKAELQELAAADRAAAEPVELDQVKMGRLSRMDALQGQQMALEVARRRQQQLVAIDGALGRLDGEAFGDCFICGEPIGLQRLLAAPSLTRCIGCVDA